MTSNSFYLSSKLAPDQSANFRMSYRFFHPEPPIDGTISLIGGQAHHAVNVMRYQKGDQIVLFDGRGTEYDAEILELTKKKMIARVIETRCIKRSLDREIKIAVTLPKGDRQKFLIEKLVELGTHELIPLSSNRSVAEVKPKVIERIEKQIIEASKQCGRNFLMRVGPTLSVKQLANPDRSDDHAEQKVPRRLVAHPYTVTTIAEFNLKKNEPVVIAIGPEGGFDEGEISTLVENGWQPVNFGPTILRIETAAIVAATILGVGR